MKDLRCYIGLHLWSDWFRVYGTRYLLRRQCVRCRLYRDHGAQQWPDPPASAM